MNELCVILNLYTIHKHAIILNAYVKCECNANIM